MHSLDHSAPEANDRNRIIGFMKEYSQAELLEWARKILNIGQEIQQLPYMFRTHFLSAAQRIIENHYQSLHKP